MEDNLQCSQAAARKKMENLVEIFEQQWPSGLRALISYQLCKFVYFPPYVAHADAVIYG